MWAGISGWCICVCVCVCVRAPESEHVWGRLSVCVCADFAWMHVHRRCVRVCRGLVHWGRAECSMAAAVYSHLMCTQSNKDDAASHHSRITGTSLGELSEQCSAGLSLAATAGVKCVWLSQSLCQSFIRLTISCRGAVRGHGRMAGATNPPLDPSKRSWGLHSLVDIHIRMNALP